MISTSAVKASHKSLPSDRTMKDTLSQLAAYNIWANQKLLEIIVALPAEKQNQELPSSFKNLYATVLHMLNAESVWW